MQIQFLACFSPRGPFLLLFFLYRYKGRSVPSLRMFQNPFFPFSVQVWQLFQAVPYGTSPVNPLPSLGSHLLLRKVSFCVPGFMTPTSSPSVFPPPFPPQNEKKVSTSLNTISERRSLISFTKSGRSHFPSLLLVFFLKFSFFGDKKLPVFSPPPHSSYSFSTDVDLPYMQTRISFSGISSSFSPQLFLLFLPRQDHLRVP